jgi:hypothetical protein
MNAVLIFLPRDTTVSDLADQLRALGEVEAFGDTAIVRSGGEKVRIDAAQAVEQEYENDQLTLPRTTLGDYALFTAEYLDIDLVKSVIRAIAGRWPSVVDDDAGTMVVGESFLELMDERPDWDWRLD